MDFVSAEKELRKLSADQQRLCHKYALERNTYAEAMWEVMVLLTPHQEEEAYRKASHEKQVLMLMADCEEAADAVRDMTLARERYKGLEKMIEAKGARISSLQSLMRYAREHD